MHILAFYVEVFFGDCNPHKAVSSSIMLSPQPAWCWEHSPFFKDLFSDRMNEEVLVICLNKLCLQVAILFFFVFGSRLSLNLPSSSYLTHLSAGITGVCHHAYLKLIFNWYIIHVMFLAVNKTIWVQITRMSDVWICF